MWVHCQGQLIVGSVIAAALTIAIVQFLRLGWVWGGTPVIIRVYRSDSPAGYWLNMLGWTGADLLILNAIRLILTSCGVPH
jgi:hypothetical protein